MKGGGSGLGAGAVFHVVAGLAIVLGVVYGVYWLLRATARGRSGPGADALEVVAHVQLAQNRAVHLVRVGDDLVLLATSEHAVAPVKTYEGDDARRLEESLAPEPTVARSPRSLVDELRRRTAR